ncbi:MAG TPA: pyruvate kinase [Patescibacteria group bacterium]|nr:pyruvate kinase [Patescibacteria group bacterium]
MKKTKIVCTIGPASESVKVLTEMVKAGMNVARLNFSHGSYENHAKLMENIRKVSQKLKTPIGIMQDLQGPKIRIAERKEALKIAPGDVLMLGVDFHTDVNIIKFLKPGHRILIEDGTIELKTLRIVGAHKAEVEVKNGALIQSHKGVNLPDSQVKLGSLTEKDKKDLEFGLKNGVDFVAISFVSTVTDVLAVRRVLAKHFRNGGVQPKVIVKVERPDAVKNFKEILKVSDAVMVARGDLGVEIDDSEVPIVQKDIIFACKEAAKPVIVATQMLDSMVRSPRPTRAEVSDVANAVMDKTDAVMLSGESAFGKYPIESVREMAKIITSTEKSRYNRPHPELVESPAHETLADQTASAACELAQKLKASAVVSASETGFAARFLSRQRHNLDVFVFTPDEKVLRQLALLYGIHPLLSAAKTIPEMLALAPTYLRKHYFVKKGQQVVRVAIKGTKKHPSFVDVVKI